MRNEVNGAVRNAVQVGTVEGDVNMFGHVLSPPVSSVRPPFGRPDSPVRGRDVVLDELTALLLLLLLCPGLKRVALLHGLGGSGKTTIALMLAHKAITNVTVDNVRINGTGGATDAFTDDKGVPVSNAGSHGMHFNLVTGTGRFDRVTVAGVKGTGSQGMANDENRYTVQRGTGNSGW